MEIGASARCPQWECVLLQPSTSGEHGRDWGLGGGSRATAQHSRDAQGAGPGSAAQHPAIVMVLLVCCRPPWTPPQGWGSPFPHRACLYPKKHI